MSTDIEWCDETINPLGWGCYGPEGTAKRPKPCSYCYARKHARRNLRDCPECNAFVPHWHPEMLEKPQRWCKPRRIFVQSMGDLFHPETPDEHVQNCIDLAREVTRHTFIFLTKNPKRYQEFIFSRNCWLGATATNQKMWDEAVSWLLSFPRRFISTEPLLGPIDAHDIGYIDWLIIGADSSRGAKKPDLEWAAELVLRAEQECVPVFVKNNYPWPDWFGPRPREFPEGIG